MQGRVQINIKLNYNDSVYREATHSRAPQRQPRRYSQWTARSRAQALVSSYFMQCTLTLPRSWLPRARSLARMRACVRSFVRRIYAPCNGTYWLISHVAMSGRRIPKGLTRCVIEERYYVRRRIDVQGKCVSQVGEIYFVYFSLSIPSLFWNKYHFTYTCAFCFHILLVFTGYK